MPKNSRFSQDSLLYKLCWEDLDSEYLRQLIGLAKIEDLAGAGLAKRPTRLGDVTTAMMPEGVIGEAQITAREPMVVCGLGIIQAVLNAYGEGCSFTATSQDQAVLRAGDSLGIIHGPSKTLLQAERIILNFLQHLCGIASETAGYVAALSGGDTALLDTRKTLPGYRTLQKYAFACGGGYNHRIGLFDRVMLKDNHLAVAGATGELKLYETVSLALATCGELPVEVEVDQIEQITPALDAGADIILLDNFTVEALKEAIDLIDGRARTEASGGIRQASLQQLSVLGLDFISTGAPVHQSRWKDIGLDWQTN